MKNILKNIRRKKLTLILSAIGLLVLITAVTIMYIIPSLNKNKVLVKNSGDILESTNTASRSDTKFSGIKSDSSTAKTFASKSSAIAPETGPSSGGNGQQDSNQEIKAGQLTAGKWSDLDNWSFWLKLMDNKEYSEFQTHWGFSLRNRCTVNVNQDNAPINDAKVTLKDGNGKVVWQARTNTKGQAELFSSISEEQQQSTLTLIVEANGQTKTLRNPTLSADTPLVVDMVSGAGNDSNILDLMFVIDTTGSMSDELEYLKTELKDVIQKIRKSNDKSLLIRLSCNYYRDHGDDYITKPFDFTENIDTVIEQMSAQRANGGGDYEEAVEEALDNAVSGHSWSQNAKARLLFLVLDAPPHHNQKTLDKLQEISFKASAAGIRIIPVASSGVDKNTEFLLRFLDIATGGTYVFLTNHSGIGNSHIEPTIGKYDVELLNSLLVRVINEYIAK